jgi:phosphoenolpyruvate carboxykinase (GTP)
MASETTAAIIDYVKRIRRDPMAMLPFCGYHMGDYFKHWLAMGKKLKHPPGIFHVNWFRVDEKGKFMWPGFGENLRVIEWIINRCNDNAEAVETPIGYVPANNALNTKGLDISDETLGKLFAVDREEWREELENIKKFFEIFGDKLPGEILEEHNKLHERFQF